VTFLVIGSKGKKRLEEITNELCPVLSIQQLYRISTMYWDDRREGACVVDGGYVCLRCVYVCLHTVTPAAVPYLHHELLEGMCVIDVVHLCP
jgi:hypothetical protein